MSDQVQSSPNEQEISDDKSSSYNEARLKHSIAIKALVLLLVFAIGSVGGFLVGNRMGHENAAVKNSAPGKEDSMALMHQINPPDGYMIPAVFGDIGPQLVAAGAIDLTKFINLYQQQDKPLSDEQVSILTKDTDTNVVINPENAYFLLNFFWALGLANQNAILTEGKMVSDGIENVGGFASTGGWTIGVKSPTELYASTRMLTLTGEQQARLLEVASGIYRPCCNNPTDFPDCNHGMAMLGLLELMASQNASSDEMFEAAKYVTAFWYPQQMLEVAIALKANDKTDFSQADARKVVSGQLASVSGFQSVHQWLAQNGLLDQAPNRGGSCAVQ